MQKYLCVSFMVTVCLFCIENAVFAQHDTLRVSSFNIRTNTGADTGNKAWTARKPYVAKVIRDYAFDIVGVQEIKDVMRDDLLPLIPGYDVYWRGRDSQDGTQGEGVAIFYRPERFSRVDSGMFWFSPTPETLSYGWGEGYRRICVWCKFVDKNTQESFYFFNVHLALNNYARMESAKLLVRQMQNIAGNNPLYCTGDYNGNSSDAGFYGTMTAAYNDSRMISKTEPTGSVGTFTGQTISSQSFPESSRIDFIFTNNEILTYTTISDRLVSDAYPSDHFPIMVSSKIAHPVANKAWYVDVDGKLSGDGTASNPFRRIEEAVAAALPFDTLYVAAGVYKPDTSEIGRKASFTFDKSLYIVGEQDLDGSPLTILSGDVLGDDVYDANSGQLLSGMDDNVASVIAISPMGTIVSLRNMVVCGGCATETSAKGGGICSLGHLSLHNVHVQGNRSYFAAGVYAAGPVSADTCFFQGNCASTQGGAMVVSATHAEVKIRTSVFANNEAKSGSALYISNAYSAFFGSNTFADNTSKNYGTVAVYNADYMATTTFVNNTFANNLVLGNKQLLSSLGGSAVYFYAHAGACLNLVHNTITGNVVEGTKSNGTLSDNLGGAVYVRSGSLLMQRNMLLGNYSQSGYGDAFLLTEKFLFGNNVFTSIAAANVTLSATDMAADTYETAMAWLPTLLNGTVANNRFTAILSDNGGITPTVYVRSDTYGNAFSVACVDSVSLLECTYNIDLDDDGTLHQMLLLDQRGYVRNKQGRAYIGAYERQADETNLTETTIVDDVQVVCKNTTLHVFVAEANPYALFTFDGRLWKTGNFMQGVNLLPLPAKGLYVLSVKERGYKIIAH